MEMPTMEVIATKHNITAYASTTPTTATVVVVAEGDERGRVGGDSFRRTAD